MGGSSWAFPAVETIHLPAMILLVGSITVFDLRLLGFALKREPVSQLAERLLPFTWTAFGVMALTGSLLFTSDAVIKYCPNPAFRIKLLLILLAGINMSVFHFTIYRNVSKMGPRAVTASVGQAGGYVVGGFVGGRGDRGTVDRFRIGG